MERVLAIPDCHFPFHDQDALSLWIYLKRKRAKIA